MSRAALEQVLLWTRGRTHHVKNPALGAYVLKTSPAPSPDRDVSLLAHQPWVRDAPVVFFMTAVVARSMWKYKHAHA